MAEVKELTAEEFSALRDQDRPTIDGAIFTLLHHDLDGIRTYRGIDRRTALALAEHGGRYFRVSINLRVSERWIGDVQGDLSRAARHVALLAKRELGIQ